MSEDLRKVTCAFSPAQSFQKHTFKHTFIGRKENTPQENTQAHTPAGTHIPGQGAE
jgi:hypothetical protein